MTKLFQKNGLFFRLHDDGLVAQRVSDGGVIVSESFVLCFLTSELL